MYNQFDEKLSSRIKDVFENFEDENADLGWQELRKRFPGEKEKKKVAMWWWQSAAAILLLSLGTWAYLGHDSEKTYFSSKSSKINKIESKADSGIIKQDESLVENPGKPISVLSPNAGLATTSFKPKAHFYKHTKKQHTVHDQDNLLSNNALHSESKNVVTVLKEEQRVVGPEFTDETDEPVSVTSTPVIAHQNSTDAFENAVISDFMQKKPAATPAGSKPAQTLAPLKQLAENPKKELPKMKEKKLSIGIFAGSFFNYASGSSSSVNTGVGLSSEIGLSKKLKLATGVSLAQNTLKYNGEIPQSAASDFVSNVNAQDQSVLLPSSLLSSGIAPTYSINKYDASLLGLDIPVNLKYTFIQNKNELYVIAGFSSNLFIEESYSYSYQVNAGKTTSASTIDDNQATSNFKNFDFARMLNLSMGFGRAIGKQNRLSFEPFIKYPLGGQGARDIRFGAAGMNLKLNFSSLKHKN